MDEGAKILTKESCQESRPDRGAGLNSSTPSFHPETPTGPGCQPGHCGHVRQTILCWGSGGGRGLSCASCLGAHLASSHQMPLPTLAHFSSNSPIARHDPVFPGPRHPGAIHSTRPIWRDGDTGPQSWGARTTWTTQSGAHQARAGRSLLPRYYFPSCASQSGSPGCGHGCGREGPSTSE